MNQSVRRPGIGLALLPGILIALFLLAISGPVSGQAISIPKVLDPNLEIQLVASEPEIVTPTGLAADRQGRLYVVESHTHARGGDYSGPSRDRVLVFQHKTPDGTFRSPTLYADGLRHALAIAFSTDQILYAVQMKSVVALRDMDGDGFAESHDVVLKIETDNNNNHGVFLGLVFDEQNRMYVSLGNIGGKAYRIEGTDDRHISGRGDTGLIVRCRADGSALERFASGFWNPPEMKFDSAGRLIVTDNDPDARGPNRVLHVVEGGDYGYQARYGSSGLHPYSAWNGELPGTLPMIGGIGEAPVGVMDCNSSALPRDYRNELLVGVWGTHEVVRVRAKPRGVSIRGEVIPILVGGESFWPTNITATADGRVYIADWADRRYPVHGKGRIWQLTAKKGVRTLELQGPFSESNAAPGQNRLSDIANSTAISDFERLIDVATDPDPFLSHAAIMSLAKPVFNKRLLDQLSDQQAARRLACVLALRKSGATIDGRRFQSLLTDPDVNVRKIALIWTGESKRSELLKSVTETASQQTSTASLFETFLATVDMLESDNSDEEVTISKDLNVDPELIRSVLADKMQPARSKAMAVRYLTDIESPQTVDILTQLARSPHPWLASQAIQTLALSPDKRATDLLAKIATDKSSEAEVRCDAVMAYLAVADRPAQRILQLVTSENHEVALAAARGLTAHMNDVAVARKFQDLLMSKSNPGVDTPLRRQLEFAASLSQPRSTNATRLSQSVNRPDSDEAWQQLLSQRGDLVAGRRVFFDGRSQCSRCHAIQGRGGRIGPDLSNIATAKTPDQILSSILHPSQDRSPDYQGYLVALTDGRVIKGTQFHYRGESAELQIEDGSVLRFKLSDTEEYRALDESLMPENLEEALATGELQDLFAFLCSLNGQ